MGESKLKIPLMHFMYSSQREDGISCLSLLHLEKMNETVNCRIKMELKPRFLKCFHCFEIPKQINQFVILRSMLLMPPLWKLVKIKL